jgi:uncharacterized protein YwgA
MEGELAVARLILELGKVKGRKRLQKIVHLLQSSGFRTFRQRFVLHYFGPYSRQLAAQLDFLRAAGLVEETETDGEYSYQPPADRDNAAVRRLLGTPEETPAWGEFAGRLNDAETPFLEAASTLVYLSRAGFRGAALRDEFSRVKPHLKKQLSPAEEFARERALIPS